MSKLLKFYSEDCPACLKLDKHLKERNIEVDKSYNIATELGSDIAEEFGIMTVPTLIQMDDYGDIIGEMQGYDIVKTEELIQ